MFWVMIAAAAPATGAQLGGGALPLQDLFNLE
jgi:hypothetical protein